MRPLLNYYGSKWNAADWIMSHFPEHKIYVEVFGGSASILLQKQRTSREVVNDLDDEIFNLYRVVRNKGGALKRALSLTPFSRSEYNLAYKPAKGDVERARRACVRAYMGIGNSITRKSGIRIGTKSMTCTARSWQSYVESLDEIVERFRGVLIENDDYREVIRRYDTPDTLFYLDPPYVASTRSCWEQYKHDWADKDHIEFLDVIRGIKGMAVVSGYDHEFYDCLGWVRHQREFKTQKKTRKTETIWINDNAVKRTAQLELGYA